MLAITALPAAYRYATTGDCLLSWWAGVVIFNCALAGLIPLVTEAEFRKLL